MTAINEDDKEQQAHMVKYWTLMSVITVVCVFTDILLLWFPFYDEIKLCLFIWLAYYKGADWLFENFISPAFKKFEPQIEATANKIGNSFVQQATNSVYRALASILGKPVADMAKAGYEAKKEEEKKSE